MSLLPDAGDASVLLLCDHGLDVDEVAIGGTHHRTVPVHVGGILVVVAYVGHDALLTCQLFAIGVGTDLFGGDGACHLLIDHHLVRSVLRAHVIGGLHAFLRESLHGLGLSVHQGDMCAVEVVVRTWCVIDDGVLVEEVRVGRTGYVRDNLLSIDDTLCTRLLIAVSRRVPRRDGIRTQARIVPE